MNIQTFLSLIHDINTFCFLKVADKHSAGDLKAIEKGEDLLKNKKIDACSYVINDEGFFVTGIVRAAMKKKVGYSFKLKFSVRGEVLNSHCECPAGKGPHGSCKHVAAVCLMLRDFKENGELNTSVSCTGRLQTFHHPTKTHTGITFLQIKKLLVFMS